jgi:chaperonin GroEL (HSP60 family)
MQILINRAAFSKLTLYQKIENGAARLLIQLTSSLDAKVGDGTTSVVILAAAL